MKGEIFNNLLSESKKIAKTGVTLKFPECVLSEEQWRKLMKIFGNASNVSFEGATKDNINQSESVPVNGN